MELNDVRECSGILRYLTILKYLLLAWHLNEKWLLSSLKESVS